MSVDDLTVPLAIAERNLAQAQEDLAAKQAELDRATAAYGVALTDKDAQIAAGLDALAAANSQIADEILNHQQIVEAVNGQLQAAQANVASLEDEVASLMRTNSELRTRNDSARGQVNHRSSVSS